MSRPNYQRTASTNLAAGGSSGQRVLEGKLAIITGASRGIGAAIAANLASKGCSLTLNYTSDSSASKTEALAQKLESSHGVRCIPVQADMGSPNGPAHLVTMAKNAFAHAKTGAFRVDIVVNNAGVANKAKLGECKVEDFAWLYDINVRGPLLLMQAVMEFLPRDRSGRVVNVSSVSATLGLPGDAMYGGTKAALEAMTRSWARELAERATVNAVNPGPVATDMYGGTDEAFQSHMANWMRHTPLAAVRQGEDREEFVRDAEKSGGRPAYESEIAGVVGMLCTPDSAWCTGCTVGSNGGMYFSN